MALNRIYSRYSSIIITAWWQNYAIHNIYLFIHHAHPSQSINMFIMSIVGRNLGPYNEFAIFIYFFKWLINCITHTWWRLCSKLTRKSSKYKIHGVDDDELLKLWCKICISANIYRKNISQYNLLGMKRNN
jgi:hypothetical protein